jgi:DNA invertase Pin-like site-specific DNA recombinase
MNTAGLKKAISYLRVSTARQGRSGLGLEAQREAVKRYLAGTSMKVIKEFVEVESGKNDERPKLTAALQYAKVTGAVLVIAKLDRLSRNVAFIDQLQTSKTKFVCADMPEANETMISFMAVMAKHEREAISQRTKVALAAVKARGKKLGNPNGARALRRAGKGNRAAIKTLKAKADDYARDVLPIIEDIRAAGHVTYEAIADELNKREIITVRGGQWHPSTVLRLLQRNPPT